MPLVFFESLEQVKTQVLVKGIVDSLFYSCLIASALHQLVSDSERSCGKVIFTMPPKKNNTGVNIPPQRPDGLTAEWAELRSTLLALQENIQATIHASINEVAEMLVNRLGDRVPTRNNNRVIHDNLFANLCDDTKDEEEDDHRRVRLPMRNEEVQDYRWESSFHVEISEFTGSIRGDKLLDWIVSVEEFLDFKQVPDDRRVPLVAMRFRGHATSWSKQFKSTHLRTAREPIQSWKKLKKHIRKTFLPRNYDRVMYNRLQNLKQGQRNVEEYAEEFSQLLTRNELYDSEIQFVSRFIGGLRPQLQNALTQFEPTSVSEAFPRASSFEQQLRSSNWSNPSARQRTTDLPAAPTASSRDSSDSSAATHNAPEETQLRRSSRPNALRCFGCGETGHRQTDCFVLINSDVGY